MKILCVYGDIRKGISKVGFEYNILLKNELSSFVLKKFKLYNKNQKIFFI